MARVYEPRGRTRAGRGAAKRRPSSNPEATKALRPRAKRTVAAKALREVGLGEEAHSDIVGTDIELLGHERASFLGEDQANTSRLAVPAGENASARAASEGFVGTNDLVASEVPWS